MGHINTKNQHTHLTWGGKNNFLLFLSPKMISLSYKRAMRWFVSPKAISPYMPVSIPSNRNRHKKTTYTSTPALAFLAYKEWRAFLFRQTIPPPYEQTCRTATRGHTHHTPSSPWYRCQTAFPLLDATAVRGIPEETNPASRLPRQTIWNHFRHLYHYPIRYPLVKIIYIKSFSSEGFNNQRKVSIPPTACHINSHHSREHSLN